MSRPIYQYRPINDRPDQAIGVLLPLNQSAAKRTISSDYAAAPSTGRGVFVSSYSTEEAALTNLINLIMTAKGERYMQPNFGTDLQKILFDNNTTELRETLLNSLSEDIAFWLPYISLEQINLTESADRHSISLQLLCRVTSVGANVVINVLANENGLRLVSVDPPEERLFEVGQFGTATAFGLGNEGNF